MLESYQGQKYLWEKNLTFSLASDLKKNAFLLVPNNSLFSVYLFISISIAR